MTRTVYVVGAPGRGKTALCRSLADGELYYAGHTPTSVPTCYPPTTLRRPAAFPLRPPPPVAATLFAWLTFAARALATACGCVRQRQGGNRPPGKVCVRIVEMPALQGITDAESAERIPAWLPGAVSPLARVACHARPEVRPVVLVVAASAEEARTVRSTAVLQTLERAGYPIVQCVAANTHPEATVIEAQRAILAAHDADRGGLVFLSSLFLLVASALVASLLPRVV